MSEGRKPLTGAQKDAVWKLARKCELMLLEQGSQKFDEALFAFASEVADLLAPTLAEIANSKVPALHWVDHAGQQQAMSLAHLQRVEKQRAG